VSTTTPWRTALVTGASSGIGAEFARTLAARHVDLVLVARSSRALNDLAQQLRSQHDVRVEVLTTDLSREGAGQQIANHVRQLRMTIDLLVNNAGFATQGRFETIDPDLDHRQAMLNVVAVVDLTHALLPDMISRGAGTVINVASVGGFQPAPYLAVYGASKAFVLSFSQALSAELRRRGVRVLALCPGPVETAFFTVLGSHRAAIGQTLPVAAVVQAALDSATTRHTVVIPGRRNQLQTVFTRVLPRRVVLTLAERATRGVTG
jgi:short-subunit dehydrogenase